MRGYKDGEDHEARYAAADMNDKLVINLRDLSHIMRSLYEGRGSQKRILIVLGELGSRVTQQELTKRLGIRPGTASEVIAKLESAGYIRRTPNETDRRTVDIVLTESGKLSAKEARAQRSQRHEEMFSCLSREEKSELLLLLEKVSKDWKERYPGMEDPVGQPGRHSGKHRHHEGANSREGE